MDLHNLTTVSHTLLHKLHIIPLLTHNFNSHKQNYANFTYHFLRLNYIPNNLYPRTQAIKTAFKQKNIHFLMAFFSNKCVCALALVMSACKSQLFYAALHYRVWSVWYNQIFSHYLINGIIFEKKSYWTWNVFWVSLQILTETFLLLRRNERDLIKKTVHWSSCEVP
jgi:hypothetical protein